MVLTRLLHLLLLLAAQAAAAVPAPPIPAEAAACYSSGLQDVPLAALPAEAREAVRLIRAGGPFPSSKDGSTFRNRESLLPARPRGYYREYTVPTPGLAHRGARRIVAGRGGELYYTDDHYRSFRRIVE